MKHSTIDTTRSGFTLIELLVVISIVSMLSSVVLASVGQARERGRIGGGILFEGHVHEGYGDQAAGFWKLDSSLEDSTKANNAAAFYRNGGQITPAFPSEFRDDRYYGEGRSLYLDGGTQDSVVFTNGTACWLSKGTIMLWMKGTTNQLPSGWSYLSLLTCYEAFGLVVRNDGTLAAFGYRAGGWNFNPDITSSANVLDNKWHQVAFTFGNGLGILYVDGREVNRGGINNASGNPSGSYYLSSGDKAYDLFGNGNLSFESSYRYTGYVADVAMYPAYLLTSSDIERIYAQSSPKYLALDRAR